LVKRGNEAQRIGMGLLVPPTVKEKDGPWYQVQQITSLFDSIKIQFGVAGTQDAEKNGSSTEFSDMKVMIFSTCDEAKSAGETLFKP
jgi:hypothetical protein